MSLADNVLFFHRTLHRFSSLMYYTLKMKIKKEMREERRERRRNRMKQTATRNVSDYSSPSPPSRGGKTKAELLTGHSSLENKIFYDHLDGERMEGRGEGGGGEGDP
jgi:hypothetical protein